MRRKGMSTLQEESALREEEGIIMGEMNYDIVGWLLLEDPMKSIGIYVRVTI